MARARVVTPNEMTAASQPPKPGVRSLVLWERCLLFWLRFCALALLRCSRFKRLSSALFSRLSFAARRFSFLSSAMRFALFSLLSLFNSSLRFCLSALILALCFLTSALCASTFSLWASLRSNLFCFFSALIFARSSFFCCLAFILCSLFSSAFFFFSDFSARLEEERVVCFFAGFLLVALALLAVAFLGLIVVLFLVTPSLLSARLSSSSCSLFLTDLLLLASFSLFSAPLEIFFFSAIKFPPRLKLQRRVYQSW